MRGVRKERSKRIRRFRLRPLWRDGGQGTVEFALVTAGLLAVVIAFGVLWRAVGGGVLVQHALASASHHLGSLFAGAATDVLLF